MDLQNITNFIYTVIDWEKFAKATHNQYRVVSATPYVDSKGLLPEGYRLTLMVIKDDFDYGVDKEGNPREDNIMRSFDATVLNRKHEVHKGDYVALRDFDAEHSYYIVKYKEGKKEVSLILRFKDYEVLQPQGGKANA